MRTVNRSALLIKPKRPLIKWANSYSMNDRELSPEYFKEHCKVILIPKCHMAKKAREHINVLWEDIFNEELRYWDPDELSWPKTRTLKLFRQWFEVEFHSKIADSVSKPIEKRHI